MCHHQISVTVGYALCGVITVSWAGGGRIFSRPWKASFVGTRLDLMADAVRLAPRASCAGSEVADECENMHKSLVFCRLSLCECGRKHCHLEAKICIIACAFCCFFCLCFLFSLQQLHYFSFILSDCNTLILQPAVLLLLPRQFTLTTQLS